MDMATELDSFRAYSGVTIRPRTASCVLDNIRRPKSFSSWPYDTKTGSSWFPRPDFEPSTNLEAALVMSAARECHVTAVCVSERRSPSSRLGLQTEHEPAEPYGPCGIS